MVAGASAQQTEAQKMPAKTVSFRIRVTRFSNHKSMKDRSLYSGVGKPTTGSRMRRIVLMVTLVVVGELVFALPFNLPRFFRPTVLEVFELTNTQLGDMFAVYGVAAMLAYFPGYCL